MIRKEKERQRKERMESLGIKEEDLIEKFIIGSGSGGQKINKTSSCVYLKHLVSAIEIKCQRSHSRDLNRYYARQELCQKLEERILGEASRKQQEIAKIKRQKRKRSKRAQEKVLQTKKRRSAVKELRKEPSADG